MLQASALVSVLLMALGGGVLIGMSVDDPDPAAIVRLEAQVAEADGRADRLERERDRIRAERNRLEARLAAGEPPPVCPTEFLSTAESNLLPFFSVDYLCGWHVVYEARVDGEREGLRVELVLFSPLPIGLAASDGPVASVELADWTDEGANDTDELPSLEAWLEEERARYDEDVREETFEGGSGVSVHRLVGRQQLFDEPVEVHVLLWEFADRVTGARHVVRAVAHEPGARARAALDRLARSFRVLPVSR
jgi:hypothetical protein